MVDFLTMSMADSKCPVRLLLIERDYRFCIKITRALGLWEYNLSTTPGLDVSKRSKGILAISGLLRL
jgi:hypothetical protein